MVKTGGQATPTQCDDPLMCAVLVHVCGVHVGDVGDVEELLWSGPASVCNILSGSNTLGLLCACPIQHC